MPEHHTEYYRGHADNVTAEELTLLKQHEPNIDFHVVEDDKVNLTQGRQSRVNVLEYESGGESYRVLWKRMAAGKGLSEEEAASLAERLEPYRQSLVRSGWQVPKLFYSEVVNIGNEYQIFSYEQYISGGDGEKMLADPSEPNFRKWSLIKQVAQTLYQYPEGQLEITTLAGREVTRLPQGLDLKLANVVLSQEDSQMYFVDLFGPKELNEAGDWLTYLPKLDSLPEEELLAVCASREGGLLRCWRLAERHWSGSNDNLSTLRSTFLSILTEIATSGREVDFIRTELREGYPWLDSIYREDRV